MRNTKKIVKDDKAEAPVGALVSISIVAAILIVLFEVIPVIGYNTQTAVNIPAGALATGTLSITGNVTCGQLVNVTNVAGNLAVFRFNITGQNNTCDGIDIAQYTMVNMPASWNTSTVAANNLTTALDANTTISGTMDATNPSAGSVVLTYNTVGTRGNEVQTSETLTNGAWGGANLSGGRNGNMWSSADNTNIANGSELWQTNSPMISVGLLIGIIAVIVGLLVGALGGGLTGRRDGGAGL